MRTKLCLTLIFFLLTSVKLIAGEHAGSDYEPGDNTRKWLELQRDGEQASTLPQPISGPVANKIYQRYQQSFTHPIPDTYTGDDADASVLSR